VNTRYGICSQDCLEKIEKYSNMYQSPIALTKREAIRFSQHFRLLGENKNSVYDPSRNFFQVKNNVKLEVGSRNYRLAEYHFHVPCEHIVEKEHNLAEIHYVFVEEQDFIEGRCPDVCGCSMPNEISGNILVLGRTIRQEGKETEDLANFPVRIPRNYFMYDGTLTTGNFAPVRWIVGRDPIYLNVLEIAPVAKHARPIQEEDGRIVLYGKSR